MFLLTSLQSLWKISHPCNICSFASLSHSLSLLDRQKTAWKTHSDWAHRTHSHRARVRKLLGGRCYFGTHRFDIEILTEYSCVCVGVCVLERERQNISRLFQNVVSLWRHELSFFPSLSFLPPLLCLTRKSKNNSRDPFSGVLETVLGREWSTLSERERERQQK